MKELQSSSRRDETIHTTMIDSHNFRLGVQVVKGGLCIAAVSRVVHQQDNRVVEEDGGFDLELDKQVRISCEACKRRD